MVGIAGGVDHRSLLLEHRMVDVEEVEVGAVARGMAARMIYQRGLPARG